MASQEGGERETVIETHAAWVVLAGGFAYKLKKPVRTAYLDFTRAETRRAMLEREAELAAAMTPWLAPRVLALTRDSDGGWGFDGAGSVQDWTLRLRRFPARAVLNHPAAAALDEAMAEKLADRVWRFHESAPQRRDRSGSGEVAAILALNAAEQRRLSPNPLPEDAVAALTRASREALSRVAGLLDRRAQAGFLRRCHGDLHLGNLFVQDGEPHLFDALEFNERLAEIDVLYDLAFLVMDLEHRGWRSAARRLLEAYSERQVLAYGAASLEGLSALPLFCSMRAAVRAETAAARGARAEAEQYLRSALAYLAPRRPALVAIGGRSGLGKTWLARRLAPQIDPSPGALIVRSDLVRKRLAGVSPLTPAPAAAYGSDFDAATYAQMMDDASRMLRAGFSVVLDATFLSPQTRVMAARTAEAAGAPFLGLWLTGPLALRVERLRARRGDASDADEAVAVEQERASAGFVSWALVDAADPEVPARELLKRLCSGKPPLSD